MLDQKFICPHCHSDNIQRFELIFNGNISNSSSSTVGIGYAGGFGIGTAETNTTSITNLGASVAPPEKKGYIKTFILGLIAIAIIQVLIQAILGRVIGSLLSYVAFGGLIYYMYKEIYLWNRDVFPQLIDQWHHSFLCLKCGHRFLL